MAKIVEIDGEDVTVFTQEEIDAKIAEVEAAKEAEKIALQKKIDDDAAHYRTKIDEFNQGKKGIDQKEKELNEKIENTNTVVEQTRQELAAEKQARLDVVKNFMFESYGGEDPEVKKKLQEEWDILNLPTTNEEEVRARAMRAAKNAGFANGSSAPSFGAPFSGGHAPAFNRNEGLKDADHDQFLKEIGFTK